jgi:hypothetical protein
VTFMLETGQFPSNRSNLSQIARTQTRPLQRVAASATR